ncbi:MAG: DUF4065 domain-containing protein [Saprospiraceae bacterium]
MYDPLLIANFFIDKALEEEIPLTHMKLQKLIYFAHGANYVSGDEPLLNETIEAWEYGPVVDGLYHKLKKYGNEPIRELQEINGEISNPCDDLDDRTIAILESVWNSLKRFTAIQLSSASHVEGSPWHRTKYEKCGGRLRMSQDIEEDFIKDFFRSRFSNGAIAVAP